MNTHIQEVYKAIESGVFARSCTPSFGSQLRRMLESIPEQQAECPACMHEELDGHGNQKPIDKLKCSCGSDCCDKCLAACANGKCSVKVCGNCAERCEGCAERHCKDCLESGACQQCIDSMGPSDKRQWRKTHAPAYCFDGD